MNRIFKILFFSILVFLIFTQFKIIDRFEIGESKNSDKAITLNDKDIISEEKSAYENYYYVSDTVYRWDEKKLSIVVSDEPIGIDTNLTKANLSSFVGPIDLKWETLMNIEYKLRYFESLEMEIYSPVFTEAIKALDGKEVIIEGFVIPFDEEGDIVSLSVNPYASCFFCGNASPASIISMKLKNKKRRYKIDDFKKFKGTLQLNYDNPEEFYYILKNAEED